MKEKFYIIDGLTDWTKASTLVRVLLTVGNIVSVKADPDNPMIKVVYVGRNPIKYVEMAAKTIHLSVRAEVKEKDLRKLNFD